ESNCNLQERTNTAARGTNRCYRHNSNCTTTKHHRGGIPVLPAASTKPRFFGITTTGLPDHPWWNKALKFALTPLRNRHRIETRGHGGPCSTACKDNRL